MVQDPKHFYFRGFVTSRAGITERIISCDPEWRKAHATGCSLTTDLWRQVSAKLFQTQNRSEKLGTEFPLLQQKKINQRFFFPVLSIFSGQRTVFCPYIEDIKNELGKNSGLLCLSLAIDRNLYAHECTYYMYIHVHTISCLSRETNKSNHFSTHSFLTSHWLRKSTSTSHSFLLFHSDFSCEL